MGGSSRCSGTLELKQGEWRPVDGYRSHLKEAAVFCRELHCGSAISVEWREDSKGQRTWQPNYSCGYSGSHLRDCVKDKPEYREGPNILELTCSGKSIIDFNMTIIFPVSVSGFHWTERI